MQARQLSTGLPELDRIIGGVLPGDNIVFEVDAIEDYLPFLEPYCQKALRTGKPLIYFRFADHPPLISEESGAHVCRLDPEAGFESFLLEVHRVIEHSGRGAFYLFDCLSDLVVNWYSDQMLANFFMLTCPYLYDLETVTYFALLRNHHSSYATAPITETAQVLLDVHRSGDDLYLRPVKVLHRYSPTMYMLHAWQDSKFVPVTESVVTSEILSSSPRHQLQSGGAHLDIWNRSFADARRAYDAAASDSGSDNASDQELATHVDRLLQMAISRDKRMLELCKKHLSASDIFDIDERMVGTGLIGGKSVGMLLARAILRQSGDRWERLLEKHDSFFVASDVFYTYLVRNGCWWGRESQRNPDTFLKGASEVRRQILRGSFPDFLIKQFSDMLDYFGQSPIIVRSSSLLEDNFGHAFAGKYESVFCANQGPDIKRMEDFLSAVRTIYASAMSEKALRYRAERGLLDRDEQMALLVQRVSGSMNGNYFYPQLAGVGFSFNPYVWSKTIDPEAGVLRLVFGLGTRAVDRSDDDYTRLIALNAPERRPEETRNRIARYAQRRIDVIDLGANQLVSNDFPEVVEQSPQLRLPDFASRDPEIERYARERGEKGVFPWVLTFDGILSKTSFVEDMRDMLHVLQAAYDYPVDVEFTGNFLAGGDCRINLVQCRPLQVQRVGTGAIATPPEDIDDADVIIKNQGAVIGHSRLSTIDRIIFVVPSVYARLPDRDRYAIARLIGDITRLPLPEDKQSIMLMGPGRWGTTTPSLGVPVSFAEISRASVILEIVAMREDLVPDVSLGTHFFAELVEMNMLYLALFPNHDGNAISEDFFEQAPNELAHLLPETPDALLPVVKVFDVDNLPGTRKLAIYANTFDQRAVCYFD
jgi:pyruvate,water dikinase